MWFRNKIKHDIVVIIEEASLFIFLNRLLTCKKFAINKVDHHKSIQRFRSESVTNQHTHFHIFNINNI